MEYSIEKQHKKGKLHAIERINCLLDKESFVEIGQKVTNAEKNYPYDGVLLSSKIVTLVDSFPLCSISDCMRGATTIM